MSQNVGLSTPRGSGTSGYVQRNYAFIKPRNAGYGAPYPPLSTDRPFKQRLPDKQILEHDRQRAIEVKVMEERERLEEENERLEEENGGKKGKGKEEDAGNILSEEEIDDRCEDLRRRLRLELEDHLLADAQPDAASGSSTGARGRTLPPKDRRHLKSYQVHELAEAKIEESERLRKALGIREDRETGEISSTWERRGERRRE